jgi:hypothetical protein
VAGLIKGRATLKLRSVLYVIFCVLFIPILLTEYSKVFSIVATSATWVSTYLFYAAQGGFTPLFWSALCLSIVNTGLIILKRWMARRKPLIYDDLGATPAGWNFALSTSHQIVTLAGIGLFITSIVVAIKA